MKISLKGVVGGGVTDVVLSGLLGIPLSIYVIASSGLSQAPKDQLGIAVVRAIHSSAGLFAAQLLIGLSCSVIGGYVAARLAKQDEVLNGLLASWLCVGIGVYSLASGKSAEPLLLHLALIAVTPVCYWAGAFLRVRGLRAVTANA